VTEPDPSPSEVPGGRTFSLEGRPAPGLYVLAWLLSFAGGALVLIGIQANPDARGALVLLGLIALALGLSSGSGYQVLARAAGRPPEAYRGPAPALAFGVAVTIGTAGGLLLGLVGLFDPDGAAGFLVGLLVVGAGYLVTVVFLVVRTGALRWSEMGWPSGPGRIARIAWDAVFGVAVTVPVVIPVLVLAGVLATILGVEPTERIPTVATRFEALLVVLAVAVVAPLGEELFFRGFALTAWQRDIGPRRALVRSAIFFALVHVLNVSGVTFGQAAGAAVLQFAVILPIGIVLGWAFQRHGIAASIAGHVGYNGALLLLAIATRQVAVQGA